MKGESAKTSSPLWSPDFPEKYCKGVNDAYAEYRKSHPKATMIDFLAEEADKAEAAAESRWSEAEKQEAPTIKRVA